MEISKFDLGVIHRRRPQEWGRGVKQKRTNADMGGGGQAKVDVHIWFKLQVFNFSNTVRIMTQESINVHCN